MNGADGAGLAATQVGSLRRVFVYRLPDDEDDAPARVVVNPEVVSSSEEPRDDARGLPLARQGPVSTSRSSGRFAVVLERHRTPRAGRSGSRRPGALPGVLQHELDHLNGVLMLDRTTTGAAPRRRAHAERGRPVAPAARRS